jgi:hypothetical protein
MARPAAHEPKPWGKFGGETTCLRGGACKSAGQPRCPVKQTTACKARVVGRSALVGYFVLKNSGRSRPMSPDPASLASAARLPVLPPPPSPPPVRSVAGRRGARSQAGGGRSSGGAGIGTLTAVGLFPGWPGLCAARAIGVVPVPAILDEARPWRSGPASPIHTGA